MTVSDLIVALQYLESRGMGNTPVLFVQRNDFEDDIEAEIDHVEPDIERRWVFLEE